jgi:hypothetical protein
VGSRPDRTGKRLHPQPLASSINIPSRVPAFTDPADVAAHPSLAALSVAFHGRKPGVADAFLKGVAALGEEAGPRYYEYEYRLSPKAIGDLLEELVTTTDWPVYSPFAKLHYGKGLAEGRTEDARESVLAVLDARGLEATDGDRQRILSSTDLNELKAWLRKAATVANVSDLFS